MAYSFVKYTGDGVTTNRSVPFPYLEETHVKVYVDGVDTAFTWLSASLIQISPAPESGAIIKVARESARGEVLVDYTATQLDEADLDTAYLHTLYLAQEAIDRANESVGLTGENDWDAQGQRITNVEDGADPQDAVTKAQLDAATLAAGNVPDPVDPADDGKPLCAAGGVFAWSQVTASGIADGAVATAKLANSAVAAAKISDGAVTPTKLSGLTPGALLFGGALGVLGQDAANLFWDAANTRLGIGIDEPEESLDVVGNARTGIEKGLLLRTQGSPFSFHTASAVFNTVRDDVSYWAYNLTPGTAGTKVTGSEPQLKFGLEANYRNGAGQNLMEWNLDYLSSDDLTNARHLAYQVDRSTHAAGWAFALPGAAQAFGTADAGAFRIESEMNGLQFVFKPNASGRKMEFLWGGASADELRIGGDGTAAGPDLVRIGPKAAGGGSELVIHKEGSIALNETSITIGANNGGLIARRVVIGAVDSGGAGFRMLRIAN